MTYYEFFQKAAEEVLVQAENGLWYLEPSYRTILESADITPDKVKEVKLSWASVLDWMSLEVKKRNTIEDKMPVVVEWLHNLITATVEPAMLEEETEYLKNLTEYLNAKKETSAI